jgi:hypothetical protein
MRSLTTEERNFILDLWFEIGLCQSDMPLRRVGIGKVTSLNTRSIEHAQATNVESVVQTEARP